MRRSPGIYFTAEENPGKPQLGDHEGAVQPVIGSSGVHYLQMTSVVSHSTLGREKERKRKGWGRETRLLCYIEPWTVVCEAVTLPLPNSDGQ